MYSSLCTSYCTSLRSGSCSLTAAFKSSYKFAAVISATFTPPFAQIIGTDDRHKLGEIFVSCAWYLLQRVQVTVGAYILLSFSFLSRAAQFRKMAVVHLQQLHIQLGQKRNGVPVTVLTLYTVAQSPQRRRYYKQSQCGRSNIQSCMDT